MAEFDSEFRSVSALSEEPFEPSDERKRVLAAVAACRRRRCAFNAEVARRKRAVKLGGLHTISAVVAEMNRHAEPVGV